MPVVLDSFEYSTDIIAQAAYVTNATIDSYTKLLLHLDNNVTDSATGKTVTNNNVTFSNTATQFKWEYSGVFNGTSAYLSIPASNDWAFGTGDLTIECWFKGTSPTSLALILGRVSGTGTQWSDLNWVMCITGAGKCLAGFSNNGSGTGAVEITSSTSINDNVWHHLACVRYGDRFDLYVDGISEANSASALTVLDDNRTVFIGTGYNPGEFITGKVDEVRVSKGIARWTANFTPPVFAYPNDLQCGSEATIKTQDSYSLKGIAAMTDSLNKILTRTVSPTKDLTGQTQIKYDQRALRTGSNIKVSLHNATGAGYTIEHTHNQSADEFETAIIDISGVADADKNAIDQIKVAIVDATAANIFYLDNMYAFIPTISSSYFFSSVLKKLFSTSYTFSSVLKKLFSTSYLLQAYLYITAYSLDLIPTMTSDTTPSGIASASYEINPAWKSMDKNISTGWATSGYGGWLAYEFTSSQIICKYTITGYSDGSAPKDWTFEGWNGSSWIILDTRTNQINWSDFEKREYLFSNSTSFIKYRINITADNGNFYVVILEIEMMKEELQAITGDYLLQAYLYITNSFSYLLKGTLWKIISDNYIFKALLGSISSTYKLTATLLGSVSSYFLFKATIFKHNILSNYILQSFLSIIIRRLYISYLTFDIYGALTTGTQKGGTRLISNPNILSQIYIYLKNTGSSGETIIDINKNGTSIFTNPSQRPHIPYNDINKFDEALVSIALTKNDIITIDIDQIAVGAADLSVILHLDTYTGLKPIVTNIDILDTSFILNSQDVFVNDGLRFKIRFENSMDSSIIPSVDLIKKDGTIISLNGSWISTILKNDTYYTTAYTELTEADIGLTKLYIKTATDKYGIEMNGTHFEFQITSFIGKLFYNIYTKEANNEITFNLISRKLVFSLDGVTYSSEENWDKTKIIDITNSAIGGNSDEGIKTLYIKFLSDIGYMIKIITFKYYYTPISSNWSAALLKKIVEGYKTQYIVAIKLSLDFETSPIKKIRVYQNTVLNAEIVNIQKYIFEGFDLTLNTNELLRQISISSGKVLLSDGSYIEIAGTIITLDECVLSDRYDMIVLDETGNYKVIKGDEGQVNEKQPFLNDMSISPISSGDKWPQLPNYPDSYIPLWVIYLKREAPSGYYYTLLYKLYQYHFDARPMQILRQLTLNEGIDNTIKIEIEDISSRTSYKEIIIPYINKVLISTRKLQAYSNEEMTIEVISGERTTAQKLWFKME